MFKNFLISSLLALLLFSCSKKDNNEIISQESDEKIAVCGDYDADGMTSTALLLSVFRELNIDAIVQAQVHDQLIINVDEKDAEKFAPYVQEIMENTTKLPGVTLKAPPEISDNWRDGH